MGIAARGMEAKMVWPISPLILKYMVLFLLIIYLITYVDDAIAAIRRTWNP